MTMRRVVVFLDVAAVAVDRAVSCRVDVCLVEDPMIDLHGDLVDVGFD